jgi:hypothetical protein
MSSSKGYNNTKKLCKNGRGLFKNFPLKNHRARRAYFYMKAF